MATRPNMIEIIANQGGISTVDAERVFEFYRTEKLMTLDGRCSGFKIKHGAYPIVTGKHVPRRQSRYRLD